MSGVQWYHQKKAGDWRPFSAEQNVLIEQKCSANENSLSLSTGEKIVYALDNPTQGSATEDGHHMLVYYGLTETTIPLFRTDTDHPLDKYLSLPVQGDDSNIHNNQGMDVFENTNAAFVGNASGGGASTGSVFSLAPSSVVVKAAAAAVLSSSAIWQWYKKVDETTDYDDGNGTWIAYEAATMAEIEAAYQSDRQGNVVLTKGTFFSKSKPDFRIYFAPMLQINVTNTNFHKVRRQDKSKPAAAQPQSAPLSSFGDRFAAGAAVAVAAAPVYSQQPPAESLHRQEIAVKTQAITRAKINKTQSQPAPIQQMVTQPQHSSSMVQSHPHSIMPQPQMQPQQSPMMHSSAMRQSHHSSMIAQQQQQPQQSMMRSQPVDNTVKAVSPPATVAVSSPPTNDVKCSYADMNAYDVKKILNDQISHFVMSTPQRLDLVGIAQLIMQAYQNANFNGGQLLVQPRKVEIGFEMESNAWFRIVDALKRIDSSLVSRPQQMAYYSLLCDMVDSALAERSEHAQSSMPRAYTEPTQNSGAAAYRPPTASTTPVVSSMFQSQSPQYTNPHFEQRNPAYQQRQQPPILTQQPQETLYHASAPAPNYHTPTYQSQIAPSNPHFGRTALTASTALTDSITFTMPPSNVMTTSQDEQKQPMPTYQTTPPKNLLSSHTSTSTNIVPSNEPAYNFSLPTSFNANAAAVSPATVTTALNPMASLVKHGSVDFNRLSMLSAGEAVQVFQEMMPSDQPPPKSLYYLVQRLGLDKFRVLADAILRIHLRYYNLTAQSGATGALPLTLQQVASKMWKLDRETSKIEFDSNALHTYFVRISPEIKTLISETKRSDDLLSVQDWLGAFLRVAKLVFETVDRGTIAHLGVVLRMPTSTGGNRNSSMESRYQRLLEAVRNYATSNGKLDVSNTAYYFVLSPNDEQSIKPMEQLFKYEMQTNKWKLVIDCWNRLSINIFEFFCGDIGTESWNENRCNILLTAHKKPDGSVCLYLFHRQGVYRFYPNDLIQTIPAFFKQSNYGWTMEQYQQFINQLQPNAGAMRLSDSPLKHLLTAFKQNYPNHCPDDDPNL